MTTTNSPEPSVSKNRILLVAFVTIFLDLLGFGIIIPIQPFYAEMFGARPFTVTLLGSSYSAMQFLFAPLLGRWSDKVGRRPIILLSIALNAGGYLLFGLAGSLGMLFGARMIAGLGGANIGAIQAVIADSTLPEERAKGMGLIGAAFGLGFIFGPALGGLFGQISPAAPAFFACGLGVCNLLLAAFFLPETRKPDVQSASRPLFSLEAWRTAARNRNIFWLMILLLVITTGFSLMEQVLGLYIDRVWLSGQTFTSKAEHVRRAAALTAYVLVVVGVVATIVQGGLIGPLTRRFGERTLIITGTTTMFLGFLLMIATGVLGSYALFFLPCVMLAFGSGINNPSMMSLLSRSASADLQGSILGQGQSLSALGRVIGPAFAGLLFEWHISTPFAISALSMLVCALIALRLQAPSTQTDPPSVHGDGAEH